MRHKIALLFLIIYIPIFISIYLSYLAAKKEIELNVANDHNKIASSVKEKLFQILQEVDVLLLFLSKHPTVIKKNVSECDSLFLEVYKRCDFCLNILLADLNGNNVGSAVFPNKAHKLNYKDKNWFQDGLKGKPHISDPHISKLFRKKTLMFTYPVFDKEKQVAVIGIPIDLSRLKKDIFSNYKLMEKANVAVVNQNGIIVLNLLFPDFVGNPIKRKELKDAIFSSYDGKFEQIGIDGLLRFYTFQTFPEYGWKVFVTVPKNVIIAESFKRIKDSLIISVVFLLFSLMFVVHMFNRLSKNFGILVEGIENVKRGDRYFRIKTEELNDEFYKICTVFNEMAENIEKSENEIKKLSKLYYLLSEVNKLIVRSSDVNKLLNEVCKCIVEIGGYKSCFIVRQETVNEEKVVTPLFYHSCEEYSLEKADYIMAITDMVINTGKIQISNEVKEADGKVGSLAAISIIFDGVVFGVLHVYSQDKDAFDDSTIHLLEELVSDIGYAIKNINLKIENEHKKALINGIFESIGEGVALIDRDLKVATVNKKYLEIVEKSEKEVVNQHYQRGFFSMSPSSVLKDSFVKGVFEDGAPRQKIVTKRGYGDILTYNIRYYPFFNTKREIQYVIKLVEDITEYKKLEAQYLHSQKLESVGRLAAGIAHDFNNILTGIIGYASLAQMIQNKEKIQENIANIIELTDKASNLTKSLLTFSRKMPSNPKIVDVNEAIENIVKIIKRVIGEDIALKLNLYADKLNVFVDPTQLEQALINLATNARDAMPKGGSLLIETTKFDIDYNFLKIHNYGREGSYAQISVTDTGVGIPKENLDKIFIPFFTTKEVGKGTGLGLSTCYGIVKNYDGFINVYSEIDKGTTFKIYLPIFESIKETTVEKREEESIEVKDLSILVVDDEEMVREIIGETLKNAGMKVDVVGNCEEALKKIIDNDYDLVLSDIVMPKMSGVELYRKAKEIKADINFLFLSGYPADFIIQNYDIELQGIIMKPISPKALYDKIVKWFKK